MSIVQSSPPLEWREVVGFEGYYRVSSQGDIKRCARLVARLRQGDYLTDEAALRCHATPKGYHRIQLVKDTQHANKMVHRLVAEAFLPNPAGHPVVNHLNGVKTDNRVVNLEWTTHSKNQQHAYRTGLKTASAKYLVVCPQLELVTVGCLPMQIRLIKMGYNADDSSIWRCINGQSDAHLDLTFVGYLLTDMNPTIRTSIEKNTARYGLSPQLAQIMQNTVREMFQE